MTKPLYCSFCGRSAHEAKTLIAGPTVFICDVCIASCNAILAEDQDKRRFAGELEYVSWQVAA